MDTKLIGKTLVDLRHEKGVTIEKVARDVNITPSALGNYERGIRIPRDEIKVRLAKYYNRTVDAIFYV